MTFAPEGWLSEGGTGKNVEFRVRGLDSLPAYD
jgi:hypothetical protein